MTTRQPPRSVNPIFNPNTFDPTTSGASVVVNTEEIQDAIDTINDQITQLGKLYTFDISNNSANLAMGGTTYSTTLAVPTGTYLMTAIFNSLGQGGNIFTLATITLTDSVRTQTYTQSGVQPTGSRASNGLMSFYVVETTSNPVISYNFNYKVSATGVSSTYTLNAITNPVAYVPLISIRMLRLT
jgi:hypothetical protein